MRCSTCPVDPGLPCVAAWCEEHAAEPNRWRATIREHARLRALADPRPTSLPAPHPALSVIAAARACPHRIDPQKCGCSEVARCALGHVEFSTDGTVSIGYCVKCPDRPGANPRETS